MRILKNIGYCWKFYIASKYGTAWSSIGQFADLGGGAWQERGDGVFEEGGGIDTPMYSMCFLCFFSLEI